MDLISLKFDELFFPVTHGWRFFYNPADNTFKESDVNSIDGYNLQYRNADASYEVTGFSKFDSSNVVAGKTNSNFTTYTSADNHSTLRLYKPSNIDGVLALTYASFGSFDTTSVAHNSVSHSWFAYGVATPIGSVPTSGSADYAAVLRGTALYAPSSDQLAVEGTALFHFNFAEFTFTGSLNPIVIGAGGDRTALTPIAIPWQNATTSRGGAGFIASTFNSSLSGGFYGPALQEIAGSFSLHFVPNSGTGSGYLIGAFAGQRCAAACK